MTKFDTLYKQIINEHKSNVVQENILSKLNPFKKKEATDVKQPASKPAAVNPQHKLWNAIDLLAAGSSQVTTQRTNETEGDKHTGTKYLVNGKVVVDIMAGNPPFIQVATEDGKFVEVDPMSGTWGLDMVYNAIRSAGAGFNPMFEENAYNQLR
jgi:hypothetical protein